MRNKKDCHKLKYQNLEDKNKIIKRLAIIEGQIRGISDMVKKERYCKDILIQISSGIVIGGLLGELASQVDWLWWLSYGESFGLSQPLTLDLSVIQLTFGLTFKMNISSIIGMILAIFIYKKI